MTSQVLKPYSIEIHIRHRQKHIPPFRNLITGATGSLSSLIIFSTCEDTIVYSIIVNYQAINMTSGTGNPRSGTGIDSETA